jgi:hypothetical protein
MLNKIKSNWFALVFILLLSLILCWPLLNPGLFLIHDDQQIARLFLFDKALMAGQFPVRWVDGLGFGYGYPLFVFYPPLVYALGEAVHVVGFGYVDSIKIVFALSILLSGITMYILGKNISGKIGGLAAAVFYMVAPYRAVDVYVRGALSESFSFVWLPLILFAFLKLSQSKSFNKYYVLLAAVSVAFLMVTHNLVLLPFLLFLVLFLVFLFSITKNKKVFSLSCIISLLLAAGLSAFFWIPSLLEKKYTIVDQILLVDLADYRSHFVYLQQLWNSLWGFGGSTAGLSDGLSFKIGKLHVVLAITAAIISLLFFKYRKRLTQIRLTLCFFALFLLAAFMTTSYSQFIWQIVTPLAYLQFPWRFLIFTTLFSSVLVGLLVFYIRITVLQIVVLAILVVLLLIPNLKLFSPSQYRSFLNDQNATAKDVISWDVSKTSFEYAPKGVDLYKGPLGTSLINITKDQIPKEKIQLLNGDAVVGDLKAGPGNVTFNLTTQNKGVVQANIFNFPNWQVNVDGQSVNINDDNKLKLITFEVPQGRHEIKIMFKNTPVRSMANIISIFSIIVAFLLTLKKWNKI